MARFEGDDDEASHLRQSAGEWLDWVNFDSTPFYPTVPTVFGLAGKRGEPVAARL